MTLAFILNAFIVGAILLVMAAIVIGLLSPIFYTDTQIKPDNDPAYRVFEPKELSLHDLEAKLYELEADCVSGKDIYYRYNEVLSHLLATNKELSDSYYRTNR